MKHIAFLFIIVTVIFNLHCKQENKTVNANTIETNKGETKISTVNAKKGTLLFFMNPDGRPCQIQDSIINEIAGEINKQLEIQYIKTTNPDDRQTFYDYTIRGLPSLIIVDKKMTVIKRFTPGIQSKETILESIKAL